MAIEQTLAANNVVADDVVTQVVDDGAELLSPEDAQADADMAAGYEAARKAKAGPPAAGQVAVKTAAAADTTQAANATAANNTVADETKTAVAAPAPATAAASGPDPSVKAYMDGEVRKVHNKIGELNRTIQDLAKSLATSKTPAARKAITAEMLKEVNDELPGLGDALAKSLGRIFDSPEGTAEMLQAKAAAEAKGQEFDPEKYFAEKVAPALKDAEARSAAQLPTMMADLEQKIYLNIAHKGWDKTVKTPEFIAFAYEGGPTEAERRAMSQLEATDPAQAERLLTDYIKRYPQWWADKGSKVMSDKAEDAISLLDSFVAKKQPAATTRTRQDPKARLERSVAPSGGGAAHQPVVLDEDAAMAQGYAKVAAKKG